MNYTLDYTLGPWIYECKTGRSDGFIFSESQPEGLNICTLEPDLCIKHGDRRKSNNWVFSEQRVADARLIAAAPDLLFALEKMLSEHDSLQIADNRTDDRWPSATYARFILSKVKGDRP